MSAPEQGGLSPAAGGRLDLDVLAAEGDRRRRQIDRDRTEGYGDPTPRTIAAVPAAEAELRAAVEGLAEEWERDAVWHTPAGAAAALRSLLAGRGDV